MKSKYEARIAIAERMAQKKLKKDDFHLSDTTKNHISQLLDKASEFIMNEHPSNDSIGLSKKLFLDTLTIWCGEIIAGNKAEDIAQDMISGFSWFILDKTERTKEIKDE